MVLKLGGAVLGIKWDTETDKFSIKLPVNITKRRRGMVTGPDLTIETLESMEGAVFTRRILLSVTMSIYDPLGFITPVSIRMKWMLQLLGKNRTAGRDDPICPEERPRWSEVIKQLVEQGELIFSRSCKPENVDLEAVVTLITFMDTSDTSF